MIRPQVSSPVQYNDDSKITVIRPYLLYKNDSDILKNKLAKARKTRKSPDTLGLKKFGPGKLWVEKVWSKNMFIDCLAELDKLQKMILFLLEPLR